jgi:predicted RNA-binding protein YlxR (DUF448 family)
MASPERTCVGCRAKAGKHDLVRVVRIGEGEVVADPAGAAQGRGAYVHLDGGCVGAAMRTKAFERALRTGLSADAAARLGIGLERLIGDA